MKGPIFIFSAGWRSGSTLLQRMVTASGEALIWGEAGGALNRFADAMECYRQMLGPGDIRYKYGYGGWGDRQYQRLITSPREIVKKWIASLNPPENIILEAFRSFFESVYGEHAKQNGYPNWGIKEVQADMEAAHFLRLLYPDAKFIFLVRHPVHCLVSIKRRKWMDCPEGTDPISFFAHHWLRLAKDFREADFGCSVKFEDVIGSSEALQRLSAYLEITVSQDIINTSHVDWSAENDTSLTFIERRRILRIVKTEMEKYGYE